jgi:hypothetical protein
MPSNLDRFKKDLDALITLGGQLTIAMRLHIDDDGTYKKQIEKHLKEKAAAYLKDLPNFPTIYQRWYSESVVLLKQILPDRVVDFIQHYEPSKTRKDLTFGSYRIRDYLQGTHVTRGDEIIVDRSAAITHYEQQFAILKAAEARFSSSLFDIRQMIQADLLDSEMEAAEQLAKYKYVRAAGAIAGVVLERHLAQVCADHDLSTGKKNPTISDFNELLKNKEIIDLPQWRFVQHLGDIRNLCDHSKVPDPTIEQVTDLINGVKKIMKTVF